MPDSPGSTAGTGTRVRHDDRIPHRAGDRAHRHHADLRLYAQTGADHRHQLPAQEPDDDQHGHHREQLDRRLAALAAPGHGRSPAADATTSSRGMNGSTGGTGTRTRRAPPGEPSVTTPAA